LRDADLTGADLTGAVLTGADLTGAVLTGADVASIRVSLRIEVDPTLPARVLAQIEAHPETHDQGAWHSSCGTRHCVAGFFTHLSGPLGRYMDRQLGTATAATLLAWRPDCEMPSFSPAATSEEIIGALRKMVECAEADAAK
ncbi:MAG TPA: pentapeptide repeat-containing protein, partial [Thermomicrobiales bacterium]|nr:pentapeptide repeat-containing protein [Thermomicrobiales bacterium]